MPIRDCPFTDFGNGVCRPVLPVRIINPHTGAGYNTYGLVDTGADECAVPAALAPLLGHNLQKGQTKHINTGNGVTVAYSHMTKVEILHPVTHDHLHTVLETPIDFMPNLNVVLLGVKNFLSDFILHMDYPEKTFNIRRPGS